MLDGVVIDDNKRANDKLRQWKTLQLPSIHGGLDGQTPYERLKQRTRTAATTPVSRKPETSHPVKAR
jgi:hypothetical protein